MPSTAAPRSSVLQPCPPLVPDPFVGRTAEWATLQSAVKSHRITVIHGAPGIGKTALLARILESQGKGRRASVFFRCSSFAREEDFWGSLLGALGRPITAATTGPLLAGHALATIEQGAITVVGDDLQRMPRSLASAIFTVAAGMLKRGRMVWASREEPPRLPQENDIFRLSLNGLPEKEGLALLAATKRGARPPRTQLSSLCRGLAGHPLALRLAAAHPDVALTALTVSAKLGHAELLETKILTPILARLEPNQKELLELAALGDGHCPRELWTALGITARTANALAAANLVDLDASGVSVTPVIAAAVLKRGSRGAPKQLVRLSQACSKVYKKSPGHLTFGLAAADYLVRAADHAGAAALLAELAKPLLDRGFAQEYLTRLSLLPLDLLENHPWLVLDRARWHAVLHGRSALVRSLLESLKSHKQPAVRAAALTELAALESAEGNAKSALQNLEQVIKIEQSEKLTDSLVKTQIRLGELHLAGGSTTPARTAFEHALALSRTAAGAITGLAQTYDQLARFGEAAPLHQRAVRLLKTEKNTIALARALIAQGNHHQLQGYYRPAGACFTLARTLYRDFGDLDQAARVAGREAALLADTGNYNKAAPLIADAILQLNNASAAVPAELLFISGLVELERGALELAATTLERAGDSFHATDSVRDIVRVQTAQAVLMRQRGNRSGAWVLFQGLLVDIRHHNWVPEEAEVLYRLASQALEEGRLDEAKSYAASAGVRFDELRNQRGSERARTLLIRVAFALGPLADAATLAQTELANARKRDDPRGLAMALSLLGEIRLEEERYPEAFKLFREALKLRQASGDSRGVVAKRRLLALAALLTGTLTEARETVSRALVEARAGGMSAELAHLHLIAGILAYRGDRLEDAIGHLDEARAHAEGVLDSELLLIGLACAIHRKNDAQAVLKQLDREWQELVHDIDPARLERICRHAHRLGIPLP